jgi:BirA family biotin operon repressor/biotin-[acetyl-CoA-carboxylase] ligase
MALTPNTVLDRCGSTNDLARALGEAGAPHGSWISAREQDAGRGRLGRQWQSKPGNLFLSVIARVEDKSRWTWMGLATAVAAGRLITERYPRLSSRFRIKWPNDLWLVPAGAKLGGILCEAVGTRAGSYVVIGIGLNCAHAPEGLDQATISISDALGRPVEADEIREALVARIVATIDELAASGPAGLVRDYARWAAFPEGAELEWLNPSQPSEPPRRGHVLGLGPSGELRVTDESGSELKLFAEDVRVRAQSR